MRFLTMIVALLAWATLAPAMANGVMPANLDCTFSQGTTVSYAKGNYKSKPVTPLAIGIVEIDLTGQRAILRNGTGRTTLRVVRAINANHFLEVVTEGFLNMTTIYDKDSATGTYPAVHSRHFGLFGEPVISQYYGFCKAAK
ncbi:MAG: hypothetical protein RLZ98_534 [Pseudomonadota bacterium]|jgi:hypothetical protein